VILMQRERQNHESMIKS